MIYSQSTVYSIEALGFLASLPAGKSVKVKELASALSIPEHFLGKILSLLVKKKFIKSSKGPTGGFTLAVDPENMTLYRILATLDSLTNLEDECVMGLNECSEKNPCALHEIWIKFKTDAILTAQKLTLKELSQIVIAKLPETEKRTR